MRQQTNLPFRLCTTVFCPGTVEFISLVDEGLVLQRWEASKGCLHQLKRPHWELLGALGWSSSFYSCLLLFSPTATPLLGHLSLEPGQYFQLFKRYKCYILSFLITYRKFSFHLTFPTTSLPSSISPPQKSCCIKLSFEYVFNMNSKYIQSHL